MKKKNYIEINKESWNTRTDIHMASDFYDNANFLKGKSSLKEIELNLLGDIKGKSILHLQCHFGQDTISLSRMGAKVTGIDLSDKAIQRAKEQAAQTNSDAQFICCNIYDLPQYLNEQFDIVYTSYGTTIWLPDLDKWANIVSQFLKPNGKFIFVEFHPTIWMFDDDFEHIKYNYFNSGEITETVEGTYAETSAPVSLENICWNHSLSEVINNLIKHGLNISSFDEYNYSPYNCVNKMIEFEPGKFRIQPFEDKVPLVFSIVATLEK